MITEKTKIHYCEHCEGVSSLGDKKVYVIAYAGEGVRFAFCRLCSSMILGTIISGRIREAIREKEQAEF